MLVLVKEFIYNKFPIIITINKLNYQNLFMKSYILIILNPKITNSDLNIIIGGIGTITDSKISKSLVINGINYFNFESSVEREDLFVFFSGLLFEISESFVLLDKDEKNNLLIPNEYAKSFLNLDFSDLNADMKQSLILDEDDFTLIDDVLLFEDDDIFADIDDELLFLNKLNFKKNKLNIDDILDKISKSGIDSLTSYEKKYLNNYK
jgi:hypothetical protein